MPTGTNLTGRSMPEIAAIHDVYYRVHKQLRRDAPVLSNATTWAQALEVALLAVLRNEHRPRQINLLAAAESVRWTTLTADERSATAIAQAMTARYAEWQRYVELSANAMQDEDVLRRGLHLHRDVSRAMKRVGPHPKLAEIFAAIDGFLVKPCPWDNPECPNPGAPQGEGRHRVCVQRAEGRTT